MKCWLIYQIETRGRSSLSRSHQAPGLSLPSFQFLLVQSHPHQPCCLGRLQARVRTACSLRPPRLPQGPVNRLSACSLPLSCLLFFPALPAAVSPFSLSQENRSHDPPHFFRSSLTLPGPSLPSLARPLPFRLSGWQIFLSSLLAPCLLSPCDLSMESLR